MKIYTIEDIIDLGSHVVKVFSSEALAQDYIKYLSHGKYEIREYGVDTEEEYGTLVKSFEIQ